MNYRAPSVSLSMLKISHEGDMCDHQMWSSVSSSIRPNSFDDAHCQYEIIILICDLVELEETKKSSGQLEVRCRTVEKSEKDLTKKLQSKEAEMKAMDRSLKLAQNRFTFPRHLSE